MTNKKSWVIIILVLVFSLTIFGYYWNQERAEAPLLYMEQFSIKLAEIAVKGPIIWGQPLFVLLGLAVFLYTLGAIFVLGEKRLIFPLLILVIGLGWAVIIEPIFGITELWLIPIVLLLSIFIAVYWLTHLFPKK